MSQNGVSVFRSDRVHSSDDAIVAGELQYVSESQCFTLTARPGTLTAGQEPWAVVWPRGPEVVAGNEVDVVLPGGTVFTVGTEIQAGGGYPKFEVSGNAAPDGFDECAEEGAESARIDKVSG